MTRSFLSAALAVSIATSLLSADTVELNSGDLLHGTVTEQSDSAVKLTHPLLGELTFTKDQIKAVNVDSDEAKAEPVEVAPEPEAKPANEWSNKILPGWEKHFEAGFNGSDGNSQTLNVLVGFAAMRENDEERTKLNLNYYRSDDDGNTTRNEANAGFTHDWLMPDSPWFKFVTGKLEYDEFTDWETRASLFAGVGKQMVKNDKHSVIGRAGLGASYEFGDVDELKPEALLGLEWDYTISDRQKLSSYVTVYPDLGDFGESRTNAGAAWSIKIDEADGMRLKFGIDNEYRSKTEGDSKHNDVKYYGAVVFDF